MSAAAVKPKGPRIVPPEVGPAGWATTYLTSTVGQKVAVAVTGLALVTFLVFHMIGNLKVFSGQGSLNSYADFLKHGLGAYVWIARAGLLAVFVAHVILAVRLHRLSAAARPVPYAVRRVAQATLASRTMLLTGLLVGAFTAFHLAHYTFGVVKPATLPVPVYVVDLSAERELNQAAPVRPERLSVAPAGTPVSYLDLRDNDGRHDVYNMVVAGFTNPLVSATYILLQLVLFAHLGHGIQSTFQTLGLKGTRFAPATVWLGYGVAGVIVGGNLAIVAGVWAGLCPPVPAG